MIKKGDIKWKKNEKKSDIMLSMYDLSKILFRKKSFLERLKEKKNSKFDII